MNIAIAQINTTAANLAASTSRMLDQARLAAERGAELVVFPLAGLTGPNPGGLTESEEFVTDLVVSLIGFAREAPVACLVPIVVDAGTGAFHEAVLVQGGKATPLVLASRAASMVSGEDDAAFDATVSFALAGVRFALAFSEDELDSFERGYLTTEVDAILYLASDALNVDDEATALAPSVSDGYFLQVASATGLWLVAVGSLGGYDEVVYTGGSFVMTPWGELAAVAPSCEEGLLTCSLDPASEGPLANPVDPPAYAHASVLWNALALCLRDFIDKQGLENVVVPITGQLTSAAVATLAVDALGPTRVHGVILSTHDDLGTPEVCRRLAMNLRIGFEDPLSSEAGDLSRGLADKMEGATDNPALIRRLHVDLANVMLAHRARELGGCVLGVSDKTSMAVDWTLPACSAAVIEPLGDVYRTDVAELARQRNTVSPVIPAEMIERSDVPEVAWAEGQSSEQLLSTLDAILYLHVERGLGLSNIVLEGFDAPTVSAVLRRLERTALCRSRAPLVPLVSQRSLADRAWPVVCGWQDGARDPSLAAEAEEALRESLEGAMGIGDASGVLEMLGLTPESFSNEGGMDSFWDDLMGS